VIRRKAEIVLAVHGGLLSLDDACRRYQLTAEEFTAGWERARSIMAISTLAHEPGAWVVEHVGTRPEFRQRGLVQRLMHEMLERGRQRGAETSDIGVLIGNEPAQRAYEKMGFTVAQEVRDADFEAVYGSPGARMLRRRL
jgi:ribosomal protein S18 acetylase RimI-like enzyme